MAKDLTYGKEAREKVLLGVSKLSKTVEVTMGPMGKNVIIGKFIGAPTITKDGVSVAREIELEDPIEELGCQLVKEVAGRTADIAGDGTTTATVLAHEIFKNGNDLINEGYSPIFFRRATEWAVSKMLEELDKLSSDVNGFNDIRDIATISANNDKYLGQKIAEAFDYVDNIGTVIAEASPGLETTVRTIDGIELNSGYITHALLSEGKTSITLNNCRILIVDRNVSQLQDCLKLFNNISETNTPILIIARSLEKEALATIVQNTQLGRLCAAAIEIPTMGTDQNSWLEDLSILLGTKVSSESLGTPLSQYSINDLGFAQKVIVGKYTTKIMGGQKDEARLSEKMDLYNEDVKILLGDLERKDIRERIAFLNSKVAVISVGYSTEVELREKGDRIEDALSATRAAIEEGIVPGGGAALLHASKSIDLSDADEDLIPAINIILSACRRPIMQIVKNAGHDPEDIIKRVINSKSSSFGYNAAKNEFCNLVESGIIDPKKVTRTALQNAASVSLLLINTEAVISQAPENPSGWQPPAGFRVPGDTSLNHKW